MGILSWIVMGLVVGVLAKFIMPGRDPGGFVITVALGIGGAFVGGYIGSFLGIGTVSGFNVPSIFVATLGAIYKELGGFWAFFSATWNTVIAYTLAVTVYQAGTFARDPVSAALWIAGCAAALAACYAWLMHLGRQRAGSGKLIPVVNL